MKKSIKIAALLLAVSGLQAQDLTSKKGEPILPEEGDWGIAIDANPFLNYAGNFFGKGGQTTTTSGTVTTSTPYSNSAPSWNFLTNNQTITGRYFLDPTTAARATVRIGMTSNTTRNTVSDVAAAAAVSNTSAVYPNALPTTENSWKHSSTTIGLAGGIEKRKGKTRLQGYYGGEFGIYLSSSRDKFTYGNNLVAPGPGVVTTVTVSASDQFAGANNFNSTAMAQGQSGPARVLDRKNGRTFSFGLRGFIGAEYFILPKISLGGEFGWGIGLTTSGASSTQWESIGQNGATGSTATVGNTTIDGARSGSFALDTDGKNSLWGPSATLRLNLYF